MASVTGVQYGSGRGVRDEEEASRAYAVQALVRSCCRCGRRHWRLLFYKIILAILERLEGQRVEGVVSKKTREETNLDKLLVSLTRVVGVVRLGTYFEVMIDWQNLLINWMVGMRESQG